MNILRQRYMLTVIITVSAGIMPQLFFKNGFLLSYFSILGLKSSSILIMLSIPSAVMFLLSVPLAYYADLYGKKRVGAIGIIFTVVGFVLIVVAGFFKINAFLYTISGLFAFSFGFTALIAGWFSLLNPLVPEKIRGTFFGTLRLSWQIFAIACSFIITFILEKNSSINTYQLILAFFTSLLVMQIFLYLRIPELEKADYQKQSIKSIISYIMGVQGYMPFCAYCFLLMLATGSWPVTLGLLEKDVLLFSDELIVHMGTMLFVGSMLGFYIGGKMVDRFGTRIVFLVVHFSYFVFLFMVLLRGLVPVSYGYYFSFLTFILGLIQAASSIALTSEMMALAPKKYSSVIISFCSALQVGGAAISGVVSGKIIEYGLLSKTWVFKTLILSNYDTLILFNSIMVFVFIVTLGLIPSVVKTKDVQWVPHSSKTL